jgi:hypothetical protein
VSEQKTDLKPIDTPVYSYLSALYKAFYSRQLYIDVGKRWKGFGFLYLFFLLAILMLPLSVKIAGNFKRAFQNEIVEPLAALPILYIQNGKLSIEQPVPFVIKNRRKEDVLIVDTSGKITDFSKEYPHLYILITDKKIAMKMPQLQIFHADDLPINNGVPMTQHFDLSTNGIFDGKQFVNEPGVARLKLFSQIIIYPILLFAMTASFCVLYLVLGLLGQFFASVFFSYSINYLNATRLLIVSSTPMLCVLFVFLTLDVTFWGMGALLLLLLAGYYYYGLFAVKGAGLQVART